MSVLTHSFVSAVADGPDATKLRPSNWNDDHVFAGGNHGSILLRDTTVATYGASWLQSVAAGSFLRSAGAASLPAWSTLVLPNSATQGDLVVATSANTLGSLADVAAGNVLVSGGVGAVPAWSASPSLTSLTLSGKISVGNGTAAAPSLTFASDTGTGLYHDGSAHPLDIQVVGYSPSVPIAEFNSGGFTLGSAAAFGFSSVGGANQPRDTILVRDGAANTLALKNGTNAQTFRIYNTTTGPAYVGLTAPADGLLKLIDHAGGYATVDALGYKVSGVAGLTASGAFTTFTIVGGLITAAS